MACCGRGLSVAAAIELLDDIGPNVLTPPPKVPLWLLFLLQFTNILMVLLLCTSLLCFVLYFAGDYTKEFENLVLALLLLLTVVVTCYETYSQEAKSDALMEKFRALVPDHTTVLRDGKNEILI